MKDRFLSSIEFEETIKSRSILIRNALILIATCVSVGILLSYIGFNLKQTLASSVFLSTVLGTLMFWNFRLGIAFIGIALLLFTKALSLEYFIEYASLDVIMVLIGLMIIVGMLKDVGFFDWLEIKLFKFSKFSAKRFIVCIGIISTLLACIVDEVTSIIFISNLIFSICSNYGISAVPFIILSVMATNVGSSGTMLGNPIGLLIGLKAKLSMDDFLIWSFPVTLLCLAVTLIIVLLWFSKEIAQLNEKMKLSKKEKIDKASEISSKKEFKIGVVVFITTMILIALHHHIEVMFNFGPNSIFVAAPLLGTGFIMLWKRNKAHYYIENDVNWWSLTFFMMLFAKAGALKFTGVTDIIGNNIVKFAGTEISILLLFILLISAFSSSVLDNVVLVAALIPVVENFRTVDVNIFPLWWALLFGGCYGGNITMVGSTANIVALGMLEKNEKYHMKFSKWIGIGLTVGLATVFVAYMWLLVLHKFMPAG
ncbi:MAG: SLC13 family permease [Endomicrobiia bacterium]